jgi:hypothetical protein
VQGLKRGVPDRDVPPFPFEEKNILKRDALRRLSSG